MRDKLCYYTSNLALISGLPVVLFFALAGIETAMDLRSFWGFVFMMSCGGFITTCGVVTAISIKNSFWNPS